MKIPTEEEFIQKWSEREKARGLVRELEAFSEAWKVIMSSTIYRTDLIQMIGDLQEKLKTAPGRALDLEEDEKE